MPMYFETPEEKAAQRRSGEMQRLRLKEMKQAQPSFREQVAARAYGAEPREPWSYGGQRPPVAAGAPETVRTGAIGAFDYATPVKTRGGVWQWQTTPLGRTAGRLRGLEAQIPGLRERLGRLREQEYFAKYGPAGLPGAALAMQERESRWRYGPESRRRLGGILSQKDLVGLRDKAFKYAETRLNDPFLQPEIQQELRDKPETRETYRRGFMREYLENIGFGPMEGGRPEERRPGARIQPSAKGGTEAVEEGGGYGRIWPAEAEKEREPTFREKVTAREYEQAPSLRQRVAERAYGPTTYKEPEEIRRRAAELTRAGLTLPEAAMGAAERMVREAPGRLWERGRALAEEVAEEIPREAPAPVKKAWEEVGEPSWQAVRRGYQRVKRGLTQYATQAPPRVVKLPPILPGIRRFRDFTTASDPKEVVREMRALATDENRNQAWRMMKPKVKEMVQRYLVEQRQPTWRDFEKEMER